MDLLSRNKVLTAGIVLLALLNVATLGTLWWQAGRSAAPPPAGRVGPRQFLETQLRLSESQKEKFEELREAYQHDAEAIGMRLHAARTGLYEALRNGGASDSAIVPEADRIGALQAELELLRIRHFRTLRLLCDGGQRRTFDGLVHDLFESASGRPGPPPDGRPPGSGGPGDDLKDEPPRDGPPPPGRPRE